MLKFGHNGSTLGSSKALITGASSGIGEALARLLHKEGIPLILCGRDEGRLQTLSTELQAEMVRGDLSNGEDRAALIAVIHREVPGLVVNAAGIGLYGPAVKSPAAEQLQLIEVDALAPYAITLEAAKALLKADRSGTILNISSAAAFFVFPFYASYAAAKACVNSYSQTLDEELSEYGVRVLCSCPGMVATRFQERAARGKKLHLRGGLMSPEKVARLLWKQIQKGKRLLVIDARYRWGIRMARLLPKRFLSKRLRAKIAARSSLE